MWTPSWHWRKVSMGLILWGTWTWVSLCNGYLIMAIKSLTLNPHQWPQVLSKAGRSTAWVKRTHSENPSSGCTLLLSLPFWADPLMIFPYIQHLLQIPVESAWPQYRSRERESSAQTKCEWVTDRDSDPPWKISPPPFFLHLMISRRVTRCFGHIRVQRRRLSE